MSTFSVNLKTHSRTKLTILYTGKLNNCLVHKCHPEILDIVAGRRKEHYFVAICKSDDCSKISSENADNVVSIWNKWNPEDNSQIKQL